MAFSMAATLTKEVEGGLAVVLEDDAEARATAANGFRDEVFCGGTKRAAPAAFVCGGGGKHEGGS